MRAEKYDVLARWENELKRGMRARANYKSAASARGENLRAETRQTAESIHAHGRANKRSQTLTAMNGERAS